MIIMFEDSLQTRRKRPNLIRISKEHPYYSMSYKGYISPARLAMAEHLDRCLGSDEYIYFVNGDSFNSSIDNLQLVSHKELTCLNRINRLQNRIGQLCLRKQYLEAQLKEVRFNHTPCNCLKCRRSREARQSSYHL